MPRLVKQGAKAANSGESMCKGHTDQIKKRAESHNSQKRGWHRGDKKNSVIK